MMSTSVQTWSSHHIYPSNGGSRTRALATLVGSVETWTSFIAPLAIAYKEGDLYQPNGHAMSINVVISSGKAPANIPTWSAWSRT